MAKRLFALSESPVRGFASLLSASTKQEIFAVAAIKRSVRISLIAVGAGPDFSRGTETQSSRLLQRLNLEWAWHLATSPTRLSGRYLRCAFLFV